MHPVLVARLAHDPPRLVAALGAMHAFFDRSFCLLGEAYAAASLAQLRKSEQEREQWEALFEGVAFGICVLGREGTAIEVANAAFMRIYGIEHLFDQDDLVRVLAKIIPHAQRTGHGKYETRHIRQSTGEYFPVQVEAVRIPGQDGSYVWGVSVHDLTDRKQVEALRARSRELELENLRVREGSRLKSEFLANMSHELRTPLNSILGFSELLFHGEVGTLADQQREFVGDILTSGRHLLGLINDVLDLSKVEAGKMDFTPEDADLEELVAEVTGVLRGVSREKEIRLRVELDPEVRHVHLDPTRLKQVLYNYLSNAIKFSHGSSEVVLRICAEDERFFRIEVADQGQGIAPDDLKRLFREFEQLDPSRAKQHGGTGLGLALTRRLVEAQNGSVGV
ncbi:MAG: PAS domain S-box protein, partial [Proteobacteria bacterium]